MGEEFTFRVCDVCGAYDDEPHHVHLWGPGEFDFTSRHRQCCAKVGCPSGACEEFYAEMDALLAAKVDR